MSGDPRAISGMSSRDDTSLHNNGITVQSPYALVLAASTLTKLVTRSGSPLTTDDKKQLRQLISCDWLIFNQ